MQRVFFRSCKSLGKRQARLILAAKQAGWLNAIIERKNDTSERPKESRLMQHRKNDTSAPFIQVSAGGYLLDMLMEAGPAKPSDMGGFRALDWVDVTAYLTNYPCNVEHYERALIIKMSDAFVAGMGEGANPFSIAPNEREIKE